VVICEGTDIAVKLRKRDLTDDETMLGGSDIRLEAKF
jgi:hypothetical protein